MNKKLKKCIGYLGKICKPCYIENVKKKTEQPNLEEFKFIYFLNGSVVKSDKYFMAYDLENAIDMFEYVCNKRNLKVEVTGVKKWNRWSGRWESFDASEYSTRLNTEVPSSGQSHSTDSTSRINFADHPQVA